MLNLCLRWLASPQQDSDREFYCYQSLSAAISRRRDGVATQERCPDPRATTGRTGCRAVGSLGQLDELRGLSKQRGVPCCRTLRTTTPRGGAPRGGAPPWFHTTSKQTLPLTRCDRLIIVEHVVGNGFTNLGSIRLEIAGFVLGWVVYSGTGLYYTRKM